MKRLTVYEPVEFSDECFTERGERVWHNMRIEFQPSFGQKIDRVLTCDKGIGITEEWIEDTIQGLLKALEKDFPLETFSVVRVKPNHVKFEYSGVRVLQ